MTETKTEDSRMTTENASQRDAAHREKLGLALSGGGFRASLFHLGVLAQMARQGLLRHVEVISTVSGGSIIGALYYLHVKRLLESKPDEEILDGDYLEIVRTIVGDFSKAVENNFRMLTFADFRSNWKMARADYSRSDRIAELYDALLYQGVVSNGSNPVPHPVQMRELTIHPPGTHGFHPRSGNADRSAKVPVLILNAATLNTGRNWHFTAQTMGEPSTSAADDVDMKAIRLRRPRPSYDSLPEHLKTFRLGQAVGASASVPAFFYPFSIRGLYRDGEEAIQVQLVDGGVHDNQGIEGLRHEKCTCFIVSDASMQTGAQNQPSISALPVLLRTSEILQDRVRAEGVSRLIEIVGENQVAFLHLRKGLPIREIPWIGPTGEPSGPVKIIPGTCQDYGVTTDVQERLSRIRTDLDSFTEVEANSLMLDGYLMSCSELARLRTRCGYPAIRNSVPVNDVSWPFEKMAPWMKNSKQGSDYLRQLDVAQYTWFKMLRLTNPWIVLAEVAVPALLLWWIVPRSFVPTLADMANLLTVGVPVYALVIIIVAMFVDHWIRDRSETSPFWKGLGALSDAFKRFFGGAVLPILGTVFVRFHLYFINPRFVIRGRLEELNRRDPR